MSQFRRDPVSGEWIIIAPERAARPHPVQQRKRLSTPLAKCPFEDLHGSGNWPPILEYDEKGKWQMAIIPNKYPALVHAERCPRELQVGPYHVTEGLGYHELLVTRDHKKGFADLAPRHALQAFRMFRERYRAIDRDECMAYLVVFGNWGPSAGASLTHPHYQLMALPVIPPNVARSYAGSERHFRRAKRCVHCDIIAAERKAGTRVIFENSGAIAIAPFVSHSPYEVKIFPKRHHAAFERSPEGVLADAAALLQKVLGRMRARLGDPDYNFYIHTAPLREHERYAHYHWQIEVVPKMGIPAGFELSTGIDIDQVDPDRVAALLRR